MVNPLTVLWQGAVVVGFLLTGLRYARQRHPESRDVFLMFGTLMGLVLASWSSALWGVSLGILVSVLLWSHPYAMLRVVDRFQPVGEKVMGVATGGFVAGGALLVAFPSPRPGLVTLGLTGYFLAAEVYAAALLVKGATSSAGATRMRLRLAALGTFLLGTAIFLAIGTNYVHLTPVIDSQLPLAMIVVGFTSFYAGFAPPRSLGRYWEYQSIHKILESDANDETHGNRVEESIASFTNGARSLMGPDALVLLLKRGPCWEIKGDLEDEALPLDLAPKGSLIQRSMETERCIVDRDAGLSAHWEGGLVRETDAAGIVAVPIAWQGEARGVCLLVLRRLPLFAEQTGSFLTLWGRDLARSLEMEALARKREEEHVEALEREKEILEEADRVKDEFLATMSHEIRTPMNAVLGSVDLLTDTPLTDQQRSYLETVARSGDHLLTIIDDLLNLSKIEAGQLDVDERPASLEAVVQTCMDMAAPKANEKGLELLHRVEAGGADRVQMDPDRMRQILTNLVSNAIKFTNEGRVKVQASIEGEGQTQELCLEVEDTGIGIPEDKIEAIFDPFQQADASTTRDHEGTGLGLAITKRLVDLMEGEIRVDSTREEGTTFHVRIPVETSPDQAPTPTEDAVGTPPKEEGPTRQHGPFEILLVEDNDVNRRVAAALLANIGYDAATAASGQEALEQIEARRFDVVLLDLQMPGMDGFEVATRVHEAYGDDARPRLIALTAHVGPAYRERARRVGIDAYLSKPIRRDELQAALQDASAATREGRDGSPPTGSDDAESLVDADQVASLREEISSEGFQDVLDVFMEEVPALLSKIEQASADGDTEAVKLHAHSLKGIARSFGAQRLAALAATFETNPAEQDTDEGLAGLEETWDETKDHLQHLR